MASIDEIYGVSKNLKAEDLKGKAHKVTIEGVETVQFKGQNGQETKLVLKLVGKQKGLVLNKTNSKVVAKYYGKDYTSWNGKEIEIFPTETEFNGQLTECIRVRVEPPKAANGGAGFENDIPF